MKKLLLLIGLVALTGSCGKSEGGDVSARLLPLQTCADVESYIRQTALEQMNQRLDEQLQQALRNEWYCGWDYGMEDGRAGGMPPAPSAPQSSTTANNSGGAKQTSGTNNQVAGVDEADFVKNDNTYIYVVSGSSFRIIQAWPATQTRVLSQTSIEGTPKKLFVHGDRALIYSSLSRTASEAGGSYGYNQTECTYGYSCSFTGDGNPTKITIFDVSNRGAPKLVRELHLSGSYLNARRIDRSVFTVISSPGVSFPGVSTYPSDICGQQYSITEILAAFAVLRAKNTRIIKETPIEDWLPSVEDRIHVGPRAGSKRELLAGCGGFYHSSLSDGSQFTTLLGLDMTAEDPASTSTIVSRPGAVYASPEALYLSVPHQHLDGYGWYPSMANEREASTVHTFSLASSTAVARYMASGVVKGHVLNQFAMDEKDGYLRIATTSGHVPDPEVHSTLTVLRRVGTTLAQAGRLDHLAPTEDIRSVRFDGDRAYMVTFKKTDPLFVFDLSQPYNPRVLAELKIPGFSTYMHMMDDEHLLTIGYDADDQGSFAWFTGVMLQIFDVSNPTNPVRTHKEVIGTRGSSSEALTNHLAFTYFAPKDVLALPMTVCEGGSGGGSYGTEMTFSGLMVYNVTTAAGFSLRGKVPHPMGPEATCHNWWTNASSQVKRSIIMDDYVYSISGDLLKVNHLDYLSNDLASISLAN